MINKCITISVLLSLFFLLNTQAQERVQYFDYKWNEISPKKNAQYGRTVKKNDAGLYVCRYFSLNDKRIVKVEHYSDSLLTQKSGKFVQLYFNGNIRTTGHYLDDKKEGLWMSYYRDKSLRDSTCYEMGNVVGESLSWHKDGKLRSKATFDEKGAGSSISWFDNGNISSQGICSRAYKKDSVWTYFHKNGNVSLVETYQDSVLRHKQYFNEDGTQRNDTTNLDRIAYFKNGSADWHKYLSKQLHFPKGFKFVKGDAAAVIIQFKIDEDGNIADVELVTSFQKEFDDIALEAVRKSPKWNPAIHKNRRVSVHFSIPVVFRDKKF